MYLGRDMPARACVCVRFHLFVCLLFFVLEGGEEEKEEEEEGVSATIDESIDEVVAQTTR